MMRSGVPDRRLASIATSMRLYGTRADTISKKFSDATVSSGEKKPVSTGG